LAKSSLLRFTCWRAFEFNCTLERSSYSLSLRYKFQGTRELSISRVRTFEATRKRLGCSCCDLCPPLARSNAFPQGTVSFRQHYNIGTLFIPEISEALWTFGTKSFHHEAAHRVGFKFTIASRRLQTDRSPSRVPDLPTPLSGFTNASLRLQTGQLDSDGEPNTLQDSCIRERVYRMRSTSRVKDKKKEKIKNVQAIRWG